MFRIGEQTKKKTQFKNIQKIIEWNRYSKGHSSVVWSL